MQIPTGNFIFHSERVICSDEILLDLSIQRKGKREKNVDVYNTKI